MTLAPAVAVRIAGMKRDTPEWTPWLERVTAALDDDASRRWDRIEVNIDRFGNDAPTAWPLLVGSLVRIPADLLGVEPAVRVERLAAAVAGELDAEGDLEALPLLRALGRRVSSKAGDPAPAAQERAKGHCPTCGAWPALAESRGLARSRRLRCGRCASDWALPWLRCVFCGESAHERLVALTPQPSQGRHVDACRSCNGYLKTIATLGPIAADELLLDDLATVALDVVAIERGFVRPGVSPLTATPILRVDP